MLYYSFLGTILVGNFLRIQVVQRDYLNPSLGSPTGLFLEFRSPRRWDYAICRALYLRASQMVLLSGRKFLLSGQRHLAPSGTITHKGQQPLLAHGFLTEKLRYKDRDLVKVKSQIVLHSGQKFLFPGQRHLAPSGTITHKGLQPLPAQGFLTEQLR